MSITLSVPPAVVQERAKESEDVYAYLMGQGGWLPDGYSFDREQANER